MTLDELQNAWSKDCEIDDSKPDIASAKSPHLHSKYLNILIQYKLKLSKIQVELIDLRVKKSKYFRGELTREELKELGWEPWQFKTLKSEVEPLIDADSDVQKLYLRESYIKHAVYFLESVLSEIKSRSFHCKNIIEWNRFRAGT